MNHKYAKKHDIADDFALNRLSDAVGIEFEEHLVGCEKCAYQVQLVRDFKEGMLVMAEEDRKTAKKKPKKS